MHPVVEDDRAGVEDIRMTIVAYSRAFLNAETIEDRKVFGRALAVLVTMMDA